jgi:hypothetical protein
MIKIIELKEKVDNGTTVSLIAECNGYENDELAHQFSRSPFVFSNELTDQEIIDSLWANEYSIYA